MKEFVSAALPWVAIGFAIAIIAVNSVKCEHKKRRDESSEDRAVKNKKTVDNHMTDGMCIGMCMGVAFGSTGIIDLATGISFGMLLGLAVGMFIKKGE